MVLHVTLWSLQLASAVFGGSDRNGVDNVGKVVGSLLPGSSPVDWCEDNYLVSSSVAEFGNTLSNVVFVVFPPVLVKLFQPFGKHIHKEVNLVWVLLFLVGVFSAYFHATLSLLGQLLDEMAILWVMMFSACIWYPRGYELPYVCANKSRLRFFAVSAALVFSLLGCVHPFVNSFALLGIGLPGVLAVMVESWRLKEEETSGLVVRASLLWTAALVCWVHDRLFCDLWLSLRFPYLHGFWHVFVYAAAQSSLVLMAYLHARAGFPEEAPALRFWPSSRLGVFSVPYVSLEARRHLKEH